MLTPKGNPQLKLQPMDLNLLPARTAVDQIIDIRTTLRYLGVPIRDMSYMFGDNRSVVTSSTIPNSTISKRHHLASYHRVREAIAAKFISFHWKDGKSNPADILSKPLGVCNCVAHAQAYPVLEGRDCYPAEGEWQNSVNHLQVQSHLEVPRILVQLGLIQRT